MIDLEKYLYDCIRPIFDGWYEDGIYAVSFFACSNEMLEYRGFSNVTDFSVSYNTEEDCGGAGRHSEKRWNYAFWRQNEVSIINSYEGTPATDVLFDWYAQQGITDVGYETDGMDAPMGFAELVEVLGKVARRFHDEGYFVRKFGRAIPILIHDLEYTPCTLDATAYANPNGEAADFLAGNWETEESVFHGTDTKKGDFLAAVAADPQHKEIMDRLQSLGTKDKLDINELLEIDKLTRALIDRHKKD